MRLLHFKAINNKILQNYLKHKMLKMLGMFCIHYIYTLSVTGLYLSYFFLVIKQIIIMLNK